jgi:L-2-hydroxyglutarate oxidase LhgO
MTALVADAEDAGATRACSSRITRISRCGKEWGIHVDGDANPCLTAARVINCAGLNAQSVARSIEGLDPSKIPLLA